MHYRTLSEDKFPLLLVPYIHSDNVPGQHVRSKLDPSEIQTRSSGQALRQGCLTYTGNVLNEDRQVTEKPNEQCSNNGVFPNKSGLYLFDDIINGLFKLFTHYLKSMHQNLSLINTPGSEWIGMKIEETSYNRQK
jgi:hypothetical protein